MVSNRDVLKALFAVLVWGVSFVATKIALQSIPPVTLIWLRFGLGVVILGAAVGIRREFLLPQKKDWPYLVLLGFLGITFHQWLQSTGLVTSQATTTSWIVASIPIFIALLGWLVLREKLIGLQVLGILLAAFGVILVVTHGQIRVLAVGGNGNFGDLLILISALNWAVFTILSRRGLRVYPAAAMMFYVMVSGWLCTSAHFLVAGGWKEIPLLNLEGWIAAGFLGIFCSGFAYIFWYDALKALPVAQLGAFLFLEPVVTVMTAAVILGEKMTAAGVLGGLMITLGVWLVNRKQVV